MTEGWHDLRRQLRAAETDRDLWADHAAVVLAENTELRDRIALLEDTVHLLRLQFPVAHLMLPADPDGPDPRWAPAIPEQRVRADALEDAGPRPPPGR